MTNAPHPEQLQQSAFAFLSTRTRRQILRSLIALSAAGLLYFYTIRDLDTQTIYSYASTYPLPLSNPFARLPQLPAEDDNADLDLPTHLWSYVPGIGTDASERIARARESPQAASDGEGVAGRHRPVEPLTDGFEWVKAVRRKAGVSEREARRVDLESGFGRAGGRKAESESEIETAEEGNDGQIRSASDLNGADGEESVSALPMDIAGNDSTRSRRVQGDIMKGKGIRPSAPRRPSWGALKMQGAKASVQTNLRDDRRYFVSFPIAGFNNELMDLFASIWLALLSSRIPIIAPIVPDHGHLSGPAHMLPLGDVFDLSYFAALKQTPVVEMHELKVDVRSAPRSKVVLYDGEVPVRPTGQGGAEEEEGYGDKYEVGDDVVAEEPEREDIGCWSSGLAWHDSATWWGGMDPADLHLTPLPRDVFAGRWERQNIFDTATVLNTLNSDLLANHSIPYDSHTRLDERDLPIPDFLPRDRLACMDSTYYALRDPERNDIGVEWREGLGSWQAVGQYMRFQPGLRRMAEDLLRERWGLDWGMGLPDYMAVHIRRGDFNDAWKSLTQRQYLHRTWQVLEEVKEHLGIDISRIVFTTDETDPDWIEPLQRAGWTFVDHARYETGEKLGYWFPTILDAVILSGAKAFLGNPDSTMSILPYRRVIDWNQGIGRWISHVHEVPDEWEWEWEVDW